MSSSLPDPPSPTSLHPLLFIWEKGRPFIRCHNVRFGATVFNPGKGRGGRFHPFPGARGRVVPTLYAAAHLDGALAETVFHNVPVRGPERRIGRFVLESMAASILTCRRDLILAQLFGFGLRRLGLSRLELIEAEKDDYPRTTSWGRALYECDPQIDGLVWVSRQNDGSRSLVLFGDRVPSSSLRVAGTSRPLNSGSGYAEVCRAANEAGILIFD